jgi:hypothetical protein
MRTQTLVIAGVAWIATLAGTRPAAAQDPEACIAASETAVGSLDEAKLINARAALSTCAAAACPDPVRTSCERRLAEVNRSIPSIVFFARSEGHDVAAVRLTVDGVGYSDHYVGNAVAADPGEHEFRFEAQGHETLTKHFVMHQGEQNRREDIVLAPVVALAGHTPEPQRTAADRAVAQQSKPPEGLLAAERQSALLARQRTLGFALGGAGLASVAVGSVFGGLALSAHGAYERHCGGALGRNVPGNVCDAQGVSGEQDTATKGDWSTVFLVGGAVAVAAGAAIVLLAGGDGGAPRVGLGPGRVSLTASF